MWISNRVTVLAIVMIKTRGRFQLLYGSWGRGAFIGFAWGLEVICAQARGSSATVLERSKELRLIIFIFNNKAVAHS